MKLLQTFSLLVLLSMSSSCALIMNDKNDQISINSEPSGADIFIEGKSYGKTPATINAEAKNSTLVLTKEGYGTAKLDLKVFATMKNGACSADALGAMFIVPLYSVLWSGKCYQFQERQYFVNIPRTGNTGASNGNSMMNMGRSPQEMINYYYTQDANNNAPATYKNDGQKPTSNNQQQYRNSGRY
jgi:hypothetical protein